PGPVSFEGLLRPNEQVLPGVLRVLFLLKPAALDEALDTPADRPAADPGIDGDLLDRHGALTVNAFRHFGQHRQLAERGAWRQVAQQHLVETGGKLDGPAFVGGIGRDHGNRCDFAPNLPRWLQIALPLYCI